MEILLVHNESTTRVEVRDRSQHTCIIVAVWTQGRFFNHLLYQFLQLQVESPIVSTSHDYGASLVAQMIKNFPAVQETQFDPWVRKIPWRREWLLTSGLENSMDRGAWQAKVYGVAKRQTWLITNTFTFMWLCGGFNELAHAHHLEKHLAPWRTDIITIAKSKQQEQNLQHPEVIMMLLLKVIKKELRKHIPGRTKEIKIVMSCFHFPSFLFFPQCFFNIEVGWWFSC